MSKPPTQSPALDEFQIPGRDRVVTVFPGLSLLTGSAQSLAPVLDLRTTVFVDPLDPTEEWLSETGWKREGMLGSTGNLPARDPDGNSIEFVEETAEFQTRAVITFDLAKGGNDHVPSQ